MKTTFRQILKDYKPIEQGDFFRQYKIDGNTFVLFSPAEGKVSCIEMLFFNEISPIDLAIILNDKTKEEFPEEEYVFEISCIKDNVIKYIFDVDVNKFESLTGEYEHYVKNSRGFILSDLRHKHRNEFLMVENESQLLFENRVSLCSNNNINAEKLFLCFDPFSYKMVIENDAIIQNHWVVVVASTNPMIVETLLEKKRDISVAISRWNQLTVLEFIVHYLNLFYSVHIYKDNSLITIMFDDTIDIEDIVNLCTKAEAGVKDMFQTSENKLCFDIKKVNNKSFITFRNTAGIIEAFCQAIVKSFPNAKNINLIKYESGF